MNKKTIKSDFIDYMLIKTMKMFKWDNLPDSIPYDILENYLQTLGNVIFYKHDDNFYCLPFSYSDKPNVYQRPSGILITNVALNISKNENINLEYVSENGVIIKSDTKERGLLPIFEKYGELLSESEITLNMLSKIARMNVFISANDEKTKKDARLFLQDIENGKLSIIGDNPIFDSVKQFSSVQNISNINAFIELTQYLKASCLNEIGINANYNLKRERINEKELQLNDYGLLPLCMNMLEERKKAIEKINEKFNLNIEVKLSDIWEVEKNAITETTDTKEVIENDDTENEGKEKTIETEKTNTKQSEQSDKDNEQKEE